MVVSFKEHWLWVAWTWVVEEEVKEADLENVSIKRGFVLIW